MRARIRVIVTRYGGVWPGAIYWFLVLSVEVFDLFTSGLFLIGVVLFMQPAAGSIAVVLIVLGRHHTDTSVPMIFEALACT